MAADIGHDLGMPPSPVHHPDQHPLLTHLLEAAAGRFPTADGTVTVLPPLVDGLECSVAFTGHAVIATALSAESVYRQQPDGFGGSLTPDFLRWLAGDGWIGVIDATLVAHGVGGGHLPRLDNAAAHARVQHALALREDVTVYGDEHGLVTLARGLAGRLEISIETPVHGGGWGRRLLADALTIVPAGRPIFAAISPGNARSLRSFLSVGFKPIGSEVIIRPRRT